MINTDVKTLLKDKLSLVMQEGEEKIWLAGPVNLPLLVDGETVNFQWYTWLKDPHLPLDKEDVIEALSGWNLASRQQSSVLVYGDFATADDTLVRMHSICHTGDIFGSQKCDCGYQLKESLRRIYHSGSGALFYLADHEGRGIGLFAKLLAYGLQQQGYDTVDANLGLGFEDDSRSYKDALAVLSHMRGKPVTLMTNNPLKLKALQKTEQLSKAHMPLWGGINLHNQFYLGTKVNKSGHLQGRELDVAAR